jgi:hypothetical protein
MAQDNKKKKDNIVLSFDMDKPVGTGANREVAIRIFSYNGKSPKGCILDWIKVNNQLIETDAKTNRDTGEYSFSFPFPDDVPVVVKVQYYDGSKSATTSNVSSQEKIGSKCTIAQAYDSLKKKLDNSVTFRCWINYFEQWLESLSPLKKKTAIANIRQLKTEDAAVLIHQLAKKIGFVESKKFDKMNTFAQTNSLFDKIN